jgi:protocatechuate 3,4-dioxygenase beta subunit
VVTGDSNDPVRRARVSITSDVATSRLAFTDAEGRFQFGGLAAGPYTLQADKAGYVATTPTDLPGGGFARIDMTDGATANDVELRLVKGAAISGRIVDVYGEPVVDAVVMVEAADQANGPGRFIPVATTQTDDLGEYRLGGLAPGRFLVSAEGVMSRQNVLSSTNTIIVGQAVTASNTASRIYYPDVSDRKQAQTIALLAGEERSTVDIAVSGIRREIIEVGDAIGPSDAVMPPRASDPAATGSIRGQVMSADGRPLSGAGVALRVISASPPLRPPRFTTADEDGRYEFTDLAGGQYIVSAGKSGYLSVEFGHPRGSPRGEPIVVGHGSLRERVDLSLSRAPAITGRITDEDGDPVDGAVVRLMHVRFVDGRRRVVEVPDVPQRRTDDLGRYRLYGLRPGQYLVSATVGQIAPRQPVPQVEGYAPTFAPGTANSSQAQTVVVSPLQDTANVDVAMLPMATARIRGRAFWSSGEPVTGGLKLLVSRRSGGVLTETGARIDPDGAFGFPNVTPGEYVIQARKSKTQEAGDVGAGDHDPLCGKLAFRPVIRVPRRSAFRIRRSSVPGMRSGASLPIIYRWEHRLTTLIVSSAAPSQLGLRGSASVAAEASRLKADRFRGQSSLTTEL